MAARPLRALVVDNDDAVRELMLRALIRVGFQCDAVADGQSAAELTNATCYDVLVTELLLPRLNGHALIRHFLRSQHAPLVLVLTDVNQPEIFEDLRARGVNRIFLKPVNRDAVAAEIKALLAPRAAEKNRTEAGVEQFASWQVAPVSVQKQEPALVPLQASDSADGADDAPSGQINHNCVVLLDDRERAGELATALSSENVYARSVDGIDALHRILNEQSVDLLILGNDLTGFLSGFELLRRLDRDGIRPATVLIAKPTWENVDQARLLAIDQLLSPDTDSRGIVDVVRKQLATIRPAGIFIPPLAAKLAQLCDVPPLPQLVVKLASFLGMKSEDIPLDDLVSSVSLDPKATAILLKLINSSAMGLSRKTASVFDAVNLLGAKRSIGLIFASGVVETQTGLLDFWTPDLRQWYGQRSALIASYASAFAERMEDASPDSAFLLGLLQEIGILAIAYDKRERYLQTAVQRSRENVQTRLDHTERHDYQVTHAQVSAALVKKWELPDSLIGPILHHHEEHSDLIPRPTLERSFIRAMRIGEAFADLADNPHPHRHTQLTQLLAEYGGEESSRVKQCLAHATAKSVQCSQLLSLPGPDAAELETLVDQVTSSEDYLAAVGQ